MMRYQQKNFLQKLQMEEEAEREKLQRLTSQPPHPIDDKLRAQYLQSHQPGLLYPTSYHLQKTVLLPPSSLSTSSFPSSSSSPTTPSSPNDPFSALEAFHGQHDLLPPPPSPPRNYEGGGGGGGEGGEGEAGLPPPGRERLFPPGPPDGFGLDFEEDDPTLNLMDYLEQSGEEEEEPLKIKQEGALASSGATCAQDGFSLQNPSFPSFPFDFSQAGAAAGGAMFTFHQGPGAPINSPILLDKKKKRRESHNAVEQRRRNNINEGINELSQLLPDAELGAQGKANKGIVLRKSADYIRHLQEVNRRLQQQLLQQATIATPQAQNGGSV